MLVGFATALQSHNCFSANVWYNVFISKGSLMFTFSCSTCETKLVVKDENFIGKILACPKCGSMVLVAPPNVAPTPSVPPQKKAPVQKRFPDVLTFETASGVIGAIPEENRRSNLVMEIVAPQTDVSEKELKTRKILLAILVGLIFVLLITLGFLMIVREPAPQPEQPLQPPINVPILDQPEPLPVEQPPVDPPPVEQPQIKQPLVEPGTPKLVEPTEPIDVSLSEPTDEPPTVPNSTSSGTTPPDIGEEMSGFIDISVPNIDIDARLALPILELKFEQQRLIGFVRNLSQWTGISMTLLIDEMKAQGLSAQTEVSGQFSETTAEEVLTETLATLGLQWSAADRQILITPKETGENIELTFDVSDLVENTDDLTQEVLAEMIQKLVVPEESVTILSNNRLALTKNSNNKSAIRQQNEVQRFLEQLRLIRELPPQMELTGEEVAPEAFGWDRVLQPVTLNYYQAVPLSRAVSQLESLTDLTILVDHQSLHRTFCSFASLQVTVQCDHRPINAAMELLLASVDSSALVYRIIDNETLEITTAESARQPEKMVMEVHRYHLSEDNGTPEEVASLLRLAIAPETWSAAELSETPLPEMQFGGAIVIDVPSQCLFVRQSQPVHRQIRLYLAESAPLAP